MAKRVLVSKAYKKARRKSKARILAIAGFGVCALALWLSYFVTNTRMLVASTAVAIVADQQSAQYPNRIKQDLESRIRDSVEGLARDTVVGIIPGDHRLRMNESSIKDIVQTVDPRIESVQVQNIAPWYDSPEYHVDIAMHKPIALWCGAKGWCVSFDMRGYALGPQGSISTVASSSDSLFALDYAETVPNFYATAMNDEAVPGDVLISMNDLDIALTTLKTIRQEKITVNRIVVEDTFFAFESEDSNKPFVILVPRTVDVSPLFQRFSARFREEKKAFASLEYVDFRFGSSVYFRTREAGMENKSTVKVSSTTSDVLIRSTSSNFTSSTTASSTRRSN